MAERTRDYAIEDWRERETEGMEWKWARKEMGREREDRESERGRDIRCRKQRYLCETVTVNMNTD